MFLRKLHYLRIALKNQWLKREELDKLQNKKFRAIVVHAYKNVPFYRSLWKSRGISSDDIKTLEDAKKLPIITKKDAVRDLDSFIAENYRKWYEVGNFVKKATSGSTGSPLQMAFDKNGWDFLDAVYLRDLLAAGYNPRKPLVQYWFEDFDFHFYNKLGFMKKILISSSLSDEQQIEFLHELKPENLYYFSSILFSLAKKMKHSGVEIRPKVLFTNAEVLSNRMRNFIEDTFDTEVFDHYSCTEFNRLAWQCKERSFYHIDADSILLETIKNNEEVIDGEGRAVVTSFSNFLLPLIRYDIGDIIVSSSEKCACGRTLPILKSVEGRSDDVIKLDSKKLNPKEVADILADIDEVIKFRFVFGSKFNVEIVLTNEKKEILEKIKKRISHNFGQGVKFNLIPVKEIPKSDMGKRNIVKIL